MRYYPLIIGQSASVSTYTEAIAKHSEAVFRDTLGEIPAASRRVLLDLGSIDLSNQDEVAIALNDDPVFRAIFELGRRSA